MNAEPGRGTKADVRGQELRTPYYLRMCHTYALFCEVVSTMLLGQIKGRKLAFTPMRLRRCVGHDGPAHFGRGICGPV